jgi:hypothetical protein
VHATLDFQAMACIVKYATWAFTRILQAVHVGHAQLVNFPIQPDPRFVIIVKLAVFTPEIHLTVPQEVCWITKYVHVIKAMKEMGILVPLVILAISSLT